ncbi:MAG: GTPase ObgE [Actinomycetota bacterium]
MFVDEARVKLSGGRGGNGAVSFHREKFRPKGGPDGGHGGRGGSVVLVASPGVGSLVWLRDHPHQKAGDGEPGGGNNKTGADGADLELPVPVGTVVSDDRGEVIADLATPGDRFVVVAGGRGGRGNAAFLSGARRAPGFAELGEPAEERWATLEIRTIADVAVIGYPNSGKSTLVGALTRARPKIADYPFTTLEPQPGVIESGSQRFTICDIPGLIEGAHEGRGLGLKFLRHAERAPMILHLVDLASGRDPLEDYVAVRAELRKFREELATRPEVVALNKADVADPDQLPSIIELFRSRGVEPVVISAKERTGLDGLVERLTEVRKGLEGPAREGFALFRSEPDSTKVKREGDGWRVSGKSVERWVAMTDLSNPEGVSYLQARLERSGVEKMLAEAGATPGDEVRIGNAVLEWWPTGKAER